MKTGRNIIIGAVLALGAAGTAAVPAVAAVAAPASSVVVAGVHSPDTHFYG